MLPPELLALLFLATATTARPQADSLANASSSSTESTLDFTNSIAFNDPTPTESEVPWEDPCATNSCVPANLIPELPTAPGFDVESNTLTPPQLGPQSQPDRVITTRRPTIVTIRTSTAPTVVQRPPTNSRPGSGGDGQSIGVVERPTGDGLGNRPGEPVSAAQQTAKNTLLDNIVSGLGDTQTQPPEQGPITPAPAVIGGTMTFGSATLTLSHGLSTTIGVEPDATFISISTDTVGQTIIVISSSGTAITATVTDAPATITLPKTGFDASITDAARPGAWSSGGNRVAAPTSSKGTARAMNQELDWWTAAVLGMMAPILGL